MREKTKTIIAERAARFLDGERMVAATPGFEGPKWAVLFGLIGTFLMKQRLVVVSDRHVYVLRGSYWSVKAPQGIEAKHPIGTVEVTAGRGFPAGALRVGDRTVWVAMVYQGDAAQVAAAASGTLGDAASS
jgi:hypothetical protein